MRLFIISSLSLLFFVGCGPFSSTDSAPEENAKFNSEKFAFLSAEAKANGMLLKEHIKNLWKEKKAICGITSAIPEDVRNQMKAIRKDDSLDKDSKKAQIKALKAPFKEAKMANKAAMMQCKEEKAAELAPIKDQMQALKTACLLAVFSEKDESGKKGMKKFWAILKTLSDEDKADLNAQLESDECKEALSK